MTFNRTAAGEMGNTSEMVARPQPNKQRNINTLQIRSRTGHGPATSGQTLRIRGGKIARDQDVAHLIANMWATANPTASMVMIAL